MHLCVVAKGRAGWKKEHGFMSSMSIEERREQKNNTLHLREPQAEIDKMNSQQTPSLLLVTNVEATSSWAPMSYQSTHDPLTLHFAMY